MTEKRAIFVTGATGAQGGAVVDTLMNSGFAIRALVRDPASEAAQALAMRDVELVTGDFDDATSLKTGVSGAYGVFSVQTPPRPDDLDSEVRIAGKLVDAAHAAGVEIFVHTSVARAGEHESFSGWQEGRWWPRYWTSKAEVNEIVRKAGFPRYTILKPAYMMDNFITPKSQWMYPGLAKRGAIETAMAEDTRLDLIAASDVGRFAAAAFAEPDRFSGQEIDLAAESLTMQEVAKAITTSTGKAVAVRHMSGKQAREMGNSPGLTESQQWAKVEGYKVDLTQAASHGVPLEKFSGWSRRMQGRFLIGPE